MKRNALALEHFTQQEQKILEAAAVSFIRPGKKLQGELG
eukprot:CAMPEP_0197700154 /NCGR_PEP_ID=MMETSP1338-20131121/121600_1 /TAXON_ID=43686 ORGANISM="Pelagodinium beii, Strain RCC1491" /NCGR_SAMPLE_ID=MMETSP1338 /ASSEMBLY_ACC=CAM_ASM_000754 /LENGTH=38 /DNA_ID= /DNA_START= /DNA_END= /DNA_ORIENTATION=